MNFERNMKKRGEASLDAIVPNPYPKKKAFPLWAKVLIPAGGIALASAIALSTILPNLNVLSPTPVAQTNYFATPPKAEKIPCLSNAIAVPASGKTLRCMDPFFADKSNRNYVLSPASFLLSAAAVMAVSDGFDVAAFGLNDPEKDCKSLLESWNYHFEDTDPAHSACSRFDSGVLHQQVGGTYRFDEDAMKAIADDYIASSRASRLDYHKQATEYFRDAVGLDLPIPDPLLNSDGVITYGAIKMKDYVPGGWGSVERPFRLGKETIQVESRVFGSVYHPLSMPYYDGEGYQAFRMDVDATDLLFILPDEGVALEDIPVSAAFDAFMANNVVRETKGYVPYFHLRTLRVDLLPAVASRLTGNEKFYSKLLAKDVYNNLSLAAVLQSSDFEFNRYGVAGESITLWAEAGSAIPEEHEVVTLEVDRPFYAISMKDGFPLFVNKVNDPSI